jgi:hypothetical protein
MTTFTGIFGRAHFCESRLTLVTNNMCLAHSTFGYDTQLSLARLRSHNCARVESTRVLDLARSCHYVNSSNRSSTNFHLI